MERINNYINGDLTPPVSATYLDNIEPATGEVYSLCSDSDERDVQLAYEAAKNAFENWIARHGFRLSMSEVNLSSRCPTG